MRDGLKHIFKDEFIEVIFNGSLYLAKDTRASNFYIGSGKTKFEALRDMNQEIRRLKEVYRQRVVNQIYRWETTNE